MKALPCLDVLASGVTATLPSHLPFLLWFFVLRVALSLSEGIDLASCIRLATSN